MKKWLPYLLLLVILAIGLISWFLETGKQRLPEELSVDASSQILNSRVTMEKKILMVIAFRDFKDEEYFVTKEVLENAGFTVETTSSRSGIALGVDGGEVEIKILPKDIKVTDYAAVVFVGGPGISTEITNSDFQLLAQEFNQEGKIVAAICLAPELLAQAGLLKNKKATVWSSPLTKVLLNF